MREIKFRAKRQHWNEHDGWDEWQYANGYYHDGINYWFTIPDKKNAAIAWSKPELIDIETLGQYTGLKDKNGVEIYEGDILKGHTHLYLKEEDQYDYLGFVTWYGGEWLRWMLEDKAGGAWYLSDTTHRNVPEHSTGEIIGNIYENKELLK